MHLGSETSEVSHLPASLSLPAPNHVPDFMLEVRCSFTAFDCRAELPLVESICATTIHTGMKADLPPSELTFWHFCREPTNANAAVTEVNELRMKDNSVIIAHLHLSVCGEMTHIDVKEIMMEPHAPLSKSFLASGEHFLIQ